MKITKLIIIILTVVLAGYANISFASEFLGVLSTGLTGTVNETLTGTVLAPVVITPTGTGGSTGGGGSVATIKKGDGNGDGKVDILDFNSLLIQWGKAGTADFDKNGVVDILDFNTLLINWNK